MEWLVRTEQMLVWLANIRPETRWLLCTYGELRDKATWMLVGPHGMNCASLRSRIRWSDLCTCVGSTSPCFKRINFDVFIERLTFLVRNWLLEWYSIWKCSSGDWFCPGRWIPSYFSVAASVSWHPKPLFCEHLPFAGDKKMKKQSRKWLKVHRDSDKVWLTSLSVVSGV